MVDTRVQHLTIITKRGMLDVIRQGGAGIARPKFTSSCRTHQPLAVAGWRDTALQLEPWIPVDVVHFVGQALSPNSALHRKGLCLSALAVHSRFAR